METLIEFLSLQDPNVRYVVMGMVILGACSGVVGCFAFLRKRALVGDAVAHSVLPGICLAFILFETKNSLVLLIGAAISGWLSLILIDVITERSRIPADAAIGLVLSVFFGMGILLLTAIQKSGSAAQAGLDKYLFGSAASLIQSDVITFAVISLLIIVTVIILYKEFKLISFDRDFALSVGIPVSKLEVVLATLTVFTVAVGIQAVGVVLMAAMLITPATAASYWTRNLNRMLIYSAVVGAFSGIVGAYVSYTAPGMPTGPWIIVIASFIAILSMLFAPKRGLLARVKNFRENQRKILEENVLKIFYQMGEKASDFMATRNMQELIAWRSISKKDLYKGLNILRKKNFVAAEGNGWKLTAEGRLQSQRIVRIHRLWELYLSTYLKIAPDHVHEDAEAIEHVITPEIEERLEQLLQYPVKDPHLTNIPAKV